MPYGTTICLSKDVYQVLFGVYLCHHWKAELMVIIKWVLIWFFLLFLRFLFLLFFTLSFVFVFYGFFSYCFFTLSFVIFDISYPLFSYHEPVCCCPFYFLNSFFFFILDMYIQWRECYIQYAYPGHVIKSTMHNNTRIWGAWINRM